MTFKTIVAIAVGVSLITIATDSVNAKPLPANQFHWSSAIQEDGKFEYNGRKYNLTGKSSSEATSFLESCSAEKRVRGFLTAKGKEDYSKAEYLCGNLSVGGDTPASYNQGGEIKVFGPIYLTKKNNVLRECRPTSLSGNRVWSNCGVVVPNDTTAKVLVGDGRNAGKDFETARFGSGIETVMPILVPEVDELREKIFRERLASGYYKS